MTPPPVRHRAPAACALLALSALLAACANTPPKPAAAPATPPVAAQPPAPPPPRVMPVEAEPQPLATQPALSLTTLFGGPQSAMLSYAEKLRGLSPPEITAEIARLGEPGDSPTTQMQLALALAQTRVPADLARALGLMQRVAANPAPEARPLQPLARVLGARYLEQRRVEDERDKQAAQLRDSQRRIEQLNDRLEALRAIERSVSRPNHAPAAPALPAPGTAPPAPRGAP